MKIRSKTAHMAVLSFFLIIHVTFVKAEVAFLAIKNHYWQVWLMDDDGSNARAISNTPYDKSRLSWYKNGDLLVCGNQGELVRLSLSSQSETPVKLPFKYVNDAVISPDERYLAFSQKPEGSIYNKLWLIDIKSGARTKINWQAKGFQHEPVFSYDSKKLYFLSGNNEQNHDVMEYDLANKNVKPVTYAGLYNLDVAVNSKKQFLYSSNREGHYDIWYQDEKQVKQLTSHASLDGRPAWGADNKTIYFESNRGGVMNIWSLAINGKSDPVQLTQHEAGARYPLWKIRRTGAENNVSK